METAISMGVLTGVSWGASKYHEKRIAANDKKERREQRRHQAEIQRHKLRADLERETRQVAEREHEKARKRFDLQRLEYYDSFAQQVACADSGGYITCFHPGASTLDPASNASSSVLDTAGGALGLSPCTYIIALLLILLLAATGFFFFIADQLRQHCKKELEDKDENFEQLNVDYTTMVVSLEDAQQQLADSDQLKEASEARAEQLEKDLADTNTSLEDARKQLSDSRGKLEESVENAPRLEKNLAEANCSLNSTHTQVGDYEKELKEKVARVEQLENDLTEVNDSLEATEKDLQDSKKALEENATHAEQLETNLVEERSCLEVTKEELRSSKEKHERSRTHAEQLERNLVQAKKSLADQTALLQQAGRDCDMHRQDVEKKQTQIEASNAEVKKISAQLAALQQERNGYRLASGQSATAIQQLESHLAEVKQSLGDTREELGKFDTELCSVKQKHNDWEIHARRMLVKRCEQIQEAHLMQKYGALWRLRVRSKSTMPAAASSGDDLDNQDEHGGSEHGDGEDLGKPAEKSKDSSSSMSSEANGSGAHQQERRRERGKHTKSNAQQRVAELQRHVAFADWFMNNDESSSEALNEKLDCWVTAWQYKGAKDFDQNTSKKVVIVTCDAPGMREPQGQRTPTTYAAGRTAPQPPPGAPTAPRAMIANGLQGLQPPTEPKAMRNDPHEQTSNPKSGVLPPHLKHKQMVNKPMPTVQPDPFDWANQSLAQSTQQEAELQNQTALTAVVPNFPQPISKPKYNFLPPHLRHPRLQPDTFDWANQSLAQSTQQDTDSRAQTQTPSFAQPQQQQHNGIYASAHANTKMPSLPGRWNKPAQPQLNGKAPSFQPGNGYQSKQR
ncbi:hypothetical protein HII31_08847 [Pseudocercospora fuligena]|uniref:Uncharacterized protein n=1 Tax=Pseudocercospora fuligena TaxID=685502 RepID=A0A8H6VK64_9PEZI|nr:hypothetical protein HII31_08847 [Pseudocercospora fuligena]